MAALLCSGLQSWAHADLTAGRKNLKLWILLNSSLQLLFAVSQAVTVCIDLTPQPGRRLCVWLRKQLLQNMYKNSFLVPGSSMPENGPAGYTHSEQSLPQYQQRPTSGLSVGQVNRPWWLINNFANDGKYVVWSLSKRQWLPH